MRAQSSSTSVEAVRNPTGTWSGFLFSGHHFIKFMSINVPLFFFRRRLNVLQDGLVAVVPFAVDTCLQRSYSNTHTVLCLIRPHSPDGDRLHQFSLGDRASAPWCPRREDRVCISPKRCPFPSETREGYVFLIHVQQFFLA